MNTYLLLVKVEKAVPEVAVVCFSWMVHSR